MSNGSPTAYLLWAILSCIFLVFLFSHLWAYDRFSCLKWDAGRQPGAFKRVMTYSYLATLPLLVVFSVAMTVLKFKEGYIVTTAGRITPRPFDEWDADNRHWLLPLYFILSIAWSLELVTHLEELTFWLFLLHQGPGKREWFQSWEFRAWYLGSIIAVAGMPLTTLVSRRQLETCQAWIFLAGATAGTTTNLCFLYVLFRFPSFIHHVKTEGAEPDVVVRLSTFYHLNRIRVIFRFLFTVPLLAIGVDAIKSPYPIVGDPFALDFLLMIGGIGCFISSAITLMIFFPRSITRESGYKVKVHSPQTSAKPPSVTSPLPDYYQDDRSPSSPKSITSHGHPTSPNATRMSSFRFPEDVPTDPLHSLEPSQPSRRRNSAESEGEASPGYETDAESIALDSQQLHSLRQTSTQPSQVLTSEDAALSRPPEGWTLPPDNRRRYSDGFMYHRHGKAVQPGALLRVQPVASQPPTRRERDAFSFHPQLHPYVVHFTSPIDLVEMSDEGHSAV
ncbi:hypothetical protein BDQ17DRAFT_1344242 [Cyathus striatus]|nr:hypothetical protein BDQ17DRAFT_1344242 [Cyathus striatus]